MGDEKGQQAQGDLRCSTSSARTQDDPSYSLMSFLTQYDGVKDEILSFLDPRSLLRMTMVTKESHCLISYQLVVRIAVAHSLRSYCIVSTLLRSVDNGLVYCPTPMRMLRLLNGQKCEFCLSSRPPGYNEKLKHWHYIFTHYGYYKTFPWSGLHDCGICWTQRTSLVVNPYRQNRYCFTVSVPKNGLPFHGFQVVAASTKEHRMYRKTHVDVTGARVGPIVTMSTPPHGIGKALEEANKQKNELMPDGLLSYILDEMCPKNVYEQLRPP